MENNLKNKSKTYRSKLYINVTKYEKGMEDGWVVDFIADDICDFKIFDTEEEAWSWANNSPKVACITEDKTLYIDAACECPKPCFISDMSYPYVIENDDNYIVWHEEGGEVIIAYISNQESILSNYELVDKT